MRETRLVEEWSWPAGKTLKTKGRGRQVKGAHGVVLDREEVVRESVNKDAMQVRDHGREQVTEGTVETRADFSGEPPVERRGRRARRDTHVAGSGMERQWRADAHSVPGTRRRRGELEHTGRNWRARGGVVNSTQAPEKRESAPKGKVPSSHCTAAIGESLGVVELLKGGRIVSNVLKTERSAREDVGDENGRKRRRLGDLHQGTVKETIPAGAERVDVRAPRVGEDNAQIPALLDQGQGNATEVNTAVRTAAQRTEDHSGGSGGANTKGEAPEHPRHPQHRGQSEDQFGRC